MIAIAQLKDEIRRAIWAGSEAENLVIAHNDMFLEGLAEIQKYVECERVNNVTVVPFCKTYFKCGLTVLPAPAGVIKRVYTIPIEDDEPQWCKGVLLTQRNYEDLECWSNTITDVPIPTTAGEGGLPLGYQLAHESTDASCGRAMAGWWAIREKNIYIAPWIQSTEQVVIEWDGIRPGGEWSDEDLVNDATHFRRALKGYVQWAHERDFGADLALKRSFRDDYDEALGELMHQCREETKLRPTKGCMRRCTPTPGELITDGMPTPPHQVQMVFGGTDNPNGSQTATKFAVYNQIDGDGNHFRSWIKTTDGGNQGWQ